MEASLKRVAHREAAASGKIYLQPRTLDLIQKLRIKKGDTLAGEDVDRMRGQSLKLEPGAFGENIVARGIDWSKAEVGGIIHIGEAELEITYGKPGPGSHSHHGRNRPFFPGHLPGSHRGDLREGDSRNKRDAPAVVLE